MKTSIFFFLALLLSLLLKAQDEGVAWRVKHMNHQKTLGLSGYDPVSYFGPSVVKGKPEFQTTYRGIVYYFSSGSNRELFKADPAKYEPAYGGWCAYAMGATGEKVEVDPHTFKMVNGRLHLYYNKYFNNTLTDWNKDERKLKRRADENWAKIIRP